MQTVPWESIAEAMPSFEPTEGGYSVAKRGIVTLASGQRLFVKIGTNDATKSWINKEVKVYAWLKKAGYPYIPKVVAVTDGALALEDLSDWNFTNDWTTEKLDGLLKALDELAALPVDPDTSLFQFDELFNGWKELAGDDTSFVSAAKVLAATGTTLTKDDCMSFANQTKDCEKGRELVHDDARADNTAYDPHSGKVKLIDWNWCALGNHKLDQTALLVNVQKNGFEVLPRYKDRIDARSALFLAGFWLYHGVQPIWEGGDPSLRQLQLQNALIAYNWRRHG